MGSLQARLFPALTALSQNHNAAKQLLLGIQIDLRLGFSDFRHAVRELVGTCVGHRW